jgi:hypothetical protein
MMVVVGAVAACVAYGNLEPNDGGGDVGGAATSASPAAVGGGGRRFTVVASGDLLSHTSVLDQARADAGGTGFDYGRMLGGVRSIIEGADLAICHLETPVRAAGTDVDGTVPVFGAPEEIAGELRDVGYDRCSLASNHALDQGPAGIDATLGAFDAAGLGHAGMGRGEAESGPSVFEVAGVTVAHISASFDFNGFSPPPSEPWRTNLIDPERISNEAQAARAAGAEVVIVSLHWGREGSTEVIAEQRRVAEVLTAGGAVDVIVGHHAHVVQRIEEVNGRWVVFGLGNQLSGMGDSTGCCGVRALDGLMVRIELTEQPDGTFAAGRPEAIPTYLGRHPYRVVPAAVALTDPALADGVPAGELADSLARTTAVVGDFVHP